MSLNVNHPTFEITSSRHFGKSKPHLRSQTSISAIKNPFTKLSTQILEVKNQLKNKKISPNRSYGEFLKINISKII